MEKVLVIGAAGQIGSELTPALRERYGQEQVVASDLHAPQDPALLGDGPFAELDVLNMEALFNLIQEGEFTQIYHLASLLSAVGEKYPQKAWALNAGSVVNVLEAARNFGVGRVFLPSSIAAFGPTTPLDNTPQDTIQRPNTMYGVTKIAMELLGDYYFEKFGVDCRGVRFPGIISYKTPPGGGTTDYAIDMMIHAVQGKDYTCYLREDTSLDMMYMPDAVRATMELMEAPTETLTHRNAFNLTAVQFTPAQLHYALCKHFPDFKVSYEIDPIRQAIADSWPNSMDDSAARNEWGWKHEYNTEAMLEDMILHLKERY